MNVKYTAKSLADIAEQFAEKAKARRRGIEQATALKLTRQHIAEAKAEAAAWEQAADILRRTTIVA